MVVPRIMGVALPAASLDNANGMDNTLISFSYYFFERPLHSSPAFTNGIFDMALNPRTYLYLIEHSQQQNTFSFLYLVLFLVYPVVSVCVSPSFFTTGIVFNLRHLQVYLPVYRERVVSLSLTFDISSDGRTTTSTTGTTDTMKKYQVSTIIVISFLTHSFHLPQNEVHEECSDGAICSIDHEPFHNAASHFDDSDISSRSFDRFFSIETTVFPDSIE